MACSCCLRPRSSLFPHLLARCLFQHCFLRFAVAMACSCCLFPHPLVRCLFPHLLARYCADHFVGGCQLAYCFVLVRYPVRYFALACLQLAVACTFAEPVARAVVRVALHFPAFELLVYCVQALCSFLEQLFEEE